MLEVSVPRHPPSSILPVPKLLLPFIHAILPSMAPRRKKLLMAGVLLSASLAAILFFVRNREPQYDGQPLSYWLRDYAVGDPRENTRQFEEAVSEIGTNAIPYLLKWIGEEPWQTKSATHRALNVSIRWLNRKLSPRTDWTRETGASHLVRLSRVADAFGVLGDKARPAIPELERILYGAKDEFTIQYVAKALGKLGQPGFSPLTRALTNSNATIREAAILGIGNLGTNARPALPLLIGILETPTDKAYSAAAWTLGQLKMEPDLVVPALTKSISSTNFLVRYRSVESLGYYGASARSAIPALTNSYATDKTLRRRTLEALHAIDPQFDINAVKALTNAPPPGAPPSR